MENQITIKTINYQGHEIVVTADETGMIYVAGHATSTPVTAQGLTFVWAGKQSGLPRGAKIAFDDQQMATIDAHRRAHIEAGKAYARKRREWNNANNEGGEGFNPYG